MIVYTIGHSNVDAERVAQLLREYGVERVLDVRSSPYSRVAPQFNRETFAESLREAGIEYRYAGHCLGGRPDRNRNPALYDGDRVIYSEVQKTEWYRQGIEALVQSATEKWTAVLCAEEDPAHCHRHRLIAQTLLDQEIEVQHIRHKGSETWTEPARRTSGLEVEQGRLFEEDEE